MPNQSPASTTDESPTITFSPFVIKKMGLVQAQSFMKIDVYTMICIPYQASAERVSLLASLSKDEIVFFQRFKGALGGLTLVFQLGNSPMPFKVFARCQVTSVLPMKGKDNVALISADFKPCPQDLARIFSDFSRILDKLKAEYGDFRGREVKITPETARSMGYNNYAVIQAGQNAYKTALYSISSTGGEFLLPMNSPELPSGSGCSVKLYFRRYQFSVPAKVSESARLPTGVQRLKTELSFSPELVEILSEHHYSSRSGAPSREASAS
jgi:hypothetical protein